MPRAASQRLLCCPRADLWRARFAAFSRIKSLPFKAGEHKRIAIKVIDPRGNEAMRVLSMKKDVEY